MEKESRRKFLAVCLGFVGAAAAGLVSYPVLSYLAPRKGVINKTKVDIPSAEVPEGGAKFFEYDGLSAVVIRKKGGAVIAFSAVCTHLGCIVQWQKEQERFLCPCHAGLYSADGTVISGPPPKPLARLPFVEADGKITIG
jgi:cytochrome b6-f complex iron-sulfur subunit